MMFKITLNKFIFVIINISILHGEELEDIKDESNQKLHKYNSSLKFNCNGTKLRQIEGKVVGGDYTDISKNPHAVQLLVYCSENNDYWACGSAIMNQRLLLTAGHCVDGCIKKYRIDAFAGSTDYRKATAIRQVRRYALHRDYDSVTVYADIAIVYLIGDLPLGVDMQRVIIQPSFPPGPVVGRMAGWGVIDEQKTPTWKLKVVTQKVWTLSSCSKYKQMLRGTICASSGRLQDYPFSGDSGSALITKEGQELGLVSYRDDGKKDLIIYTNVSYYYQWIIDMAVKLHCQ